MRLLGKALLHNTSLFLLLLRFLSLRNQSTADDEGCRPVLNGRAPQSVATVDREAEGATV